MTLRCDLIRDVEEWASQHASIEDLLSTCALATPHASTTWLSTWWQTLGTGNQLRVGLFWRGEQLVGYAPLMLCSERFLGIPCRVLRFIGDGISDYADLFSRYDDSEITAQMVAGIVETWDHDELNLNNVRGGSTTIEAFEHIRSPRHYTRIGPVERCPYIDLRNLTFEQYLLTLSRKHRRDLRKAQRKLDALGSWSLEFAPVLPAQTMFDEFRRLHRSRSAEMGWSSVFDMPGFEQQFLALMERQGTDIDVLCSTLRHESRLMSYTFGFVRDRVYYQWNVGFDHSYEDIAPNKLHHQFLIEECFRRGYVEFDFMRGAYDYKFSWTDRARDNYGIRMLKRNGWRRPVHRIRWLQERQPGSIADRCIHAVRALPTFRAAVRP